MAICKNDCLDCDNLARRNVWDKDSMLYCKATDKDLGNRYLELEVFEDDCPNFKYEE